MNHYSLNLSPNMPRKAIAIAICLAFSATAQADTDDEVSRLITPASTFSVGAGYLGEASQRFGMYNGLDEEGSYGLLDFSYNRRNEETGTWYRATGRNLGLDTREIRLEHERQGKWGYFIDYNRINRVSPYTVITGVQGIGTDQLTVPNPAAVNAEFTLKTERHRSSFGLNAALIGNTQLRVLLQNEEKDGERLFGRGTGSVMEFLAEPIHSTTRQIDLIVDYTGEALQLSGGYYGSFFKNENPVLKITGGNSAFNAGVGSTGVAFDNISLPPDNEAHQFHLAGGYQLAKTTRMSFKIAKSMATQNDDFIGVRFFNTANNGVNANTSGRNDLGGRLDTTLATLGLTSRPITDLFLLANLRYEQRDDKTSVARYITSVAGTGAAPILNPLSGTSTTDGFNEPRSLTNRSGKLEASYQLPDGYSLTGGYDHDTKERSMSGVRVVGYRHTVEEDTYRVELKRAMAESLSGSLAYLYSDRTGSDYRNLVTLDGATNYPNYSPLNCGQTIPPSQLQVTRCGLVQPIYMADRERQKVRLLTDWSPIDQLSAQLMIESAADNYDDGRGNPNIGARRGEARLYSLDISYQASDRWTFNTWISRTESSIEQATIGAVPLTTTLSNTGSLLWSANQENVVDSLGAGLRGKLPRGITIGADYVFASDRTSYDLAKEAYTPFRSVAGVNSLPDITYRQYTLKLFGTYLVDKNTTLRLDCIFDRRKIDDWTWRDWQYTDGTRIVQDPDSTARFVGMSVNYAFR